MLRAWRMVAIILPIAAILSFGCSIKGKVPSAFRLRATFSYLPASDFAPRPFEVAICDLKLVYKLLIFIDSLLINNP
jgi:hypothetical protein